MFAPEAFSCASNNKKKWEKPDSTRVHGHIYVLYGHPVALTVKFDALSGSVFHLDKIR